MLTDEDMELYRLIVAFRKAGTKQIARLVIAKTLKVIAELDFDSSQQEGILADSLPKELVDALNFSGFSLAKARGVAIVKPAREYMTMEDTLRLLLHIASGNPDDLEALFTVITTDERLMAWEFLCSLTAKELEGIYPLFAPDTKLGWAPRLEAMKALNATR